MGLEDGGGFSKLIVESTVEALEGGVELMELDGEGFDDEDNLGGAGNGPL